MRTETAQLL